jgi:hypothetical protein
MKQTLMQKQTPPPSPQAIASAEEVEEFGFWSARTRQSDGHPATLGACWRRAAARVDSSVASDARRRAPSVAAAAAPRDCAPPIRPRDNLDRSKPTTKWSCTRGGCVRCIFLRTLVVINQQHTPRKLERLRRRTKL